MAADETYRRQATLLVRTLPFVAEETCFALKGGTAINLFVRDMPRLSVDIDLTYLPLADRAASLSEIDGALRRIGARIADGLPGTSVHEGRLRPENTVTKLIVRREGVRREGVQIKIEVTPVLRGSVYEPELRTVSPRVEDEFGFAEIQVVSFADLYAGKLVAALDRQHPRDLFDVRDLLANEGIDDKLEKAFLVYLISHNRPMAEVLAPTRRDLSDEFMRGFLGMIEHPVTLDELVRTRENMIDSIVGKMPAKHRKFLIAFEQGKPDWSLIELADVEALPAVRWRMTNLAKLTDSKRRDLVEKLRSALGLRSA